ncbi:adhesion G protein-coupled receptor G3-like [Archocentrus centrarchus]|uniref:adhesion G protein-coupled receptor G3-like n=1 Tax=Archocentrus centrarchus TaxID=63155 RepID=UPI0011EA2471|nr:adhesion G protein-coupled receptor G3-like [Archocentrus centrarchus]
MWVTLFLITIICFSASGADFCESVLRECVQTGASWTRCYEDRIATCRPKGRSMPGLKHLTVDSLQEANVSPTFQHRVHIPSSALQRSRGNVSEVLVVASVINSTYFKLSPPRRSRLGQFHRREGVVFRGSVLSVRAGNVTLIDLPQPIKLIFSHDKEVENGTCVFWQESGTKDGTGYWSVEGCETTKTAEEFICSCNHLSFFAVLVNPKISVKKSDAEKLSYITYAGSGLSALFTFISLIIYICLHRWRPEKVVGLHMQLTGAMLCLHVAFLLSSLLVQRLKEDSSFCLVLGLFLHWSLLATLTWTALEGFHLYLLLVRVFNIYVRRYLLKLSLVGWGVPTLVAAICGISGVYGKYTLKDANNTTTAHICWMSSDFPQKLLLTSYITTVAFPFLVVVFNGCMLGLVVFKMWKIRKDDRDFGSNSDWKRINKAKRKRLWKDSVTVLGLSCVLGLPWGLASTTYISLAGIYVFTIFNSLQGVFVFLWSVALTWSQSRGVNNSSVRDSSSQKMMTTSFNN